ncbi:hypothetical protein GCM10023223_42840 [Stackebrandtia albiflava]
MFAAVLLVAGCAVWGGWLDARGHHLHLGNAWPLSGHWEPRITRWAVAPVLVAAVWIAWGPRVAARAPWRRLTALVYLVAVAWPVALASWDGPGALTAPLTTPYEYLHDVPRVTDLSTFLATYNDHVMDPPRWTTHVSGHPPGMLGLLTVLDRIGLGGPEWAAAMCIGAGAFAAPAVLSTVRVLSGEETARRAAPFLPAAPAALWIATSADAFFAGVAAAGVCALAHAAARTGARGDAWAVAGGLLLGGCLFLSYGLTLIGVLAVAVVVAQRRFRPLVVGGAVVVVLLLAAALAGFDWFTGLDLATQRVRAGRGWIERPEWYFWFANIAALAVAVGPATVAGLAWLRRDRFAVLPGAVAVILAVALASGLSVGETERIYLPFAVWLLPLAGLIPVRAARFGLAAQAVTAIAVTGFLVLWW